MPVCQNCNYTWSLGETLKRSFTMSTALRCPSCEAEQYITVKSRKRSAILSTVSITVVMLFNIYFGPTVYTFLFLLVALVFITITYPRLLRLSNTEEHMF